MTLKVKRINECVYPTGKARMCPLLLSIGQYLNTDHLLRYYAIGSSKKAISTDIVSNKYKDIYDLLLLTCAS